MISSLIATCHGNFNILRLFDFRNQRRLSYLPLWRRKGFSWACMTWMACMSGISGSGLCSSVSVLLWKVPVSIALDYGWYQIFCTKRILNLPRAVPFLRFAKLPKLPYLNTARMDFIKILKRRFKLQRMVSLKGNRQSPMAMDQFLLQICVQVLLYSCYHFLSKVV